MDHTSLLQAFLSVNYTVLSFLYFLFYAYIYYVYYTPEILSRANLRLAPNTLRSLRQHACISCEILGTLRSTTRQLDDVALQNNYPCKTK